MKKGSVFTRSFRRFRRAPLALRAGTVVAFVLGGTLTASALLSPDELEIVDAVEGGAFEEHVDQDELNGLVATDPAMAFTTAFAAGNEMFDTEFNASDGGGAVVHDHERYTRTPRADQKDTGEWFTHTPARATGPNAGSCAQCHSQGGDDGGGPAAANVHRDPLRGAQIGQLIQRNTPHLFGMGGVARLAEEMTSDLLAIRNGAGCNCTSTSTSTASCSARTRTLTSKGVNFGTATISRAPGATKCTVSITSLPGGSAKAVATDLIVRPFQWKGSVAFPRDFNRGAGHNELGMQAVELLSADDVDGDGDHVTSEFTVGDMTALAVYIQGQPRPTTRQELASLGIIPPLTAEEDAAISRGSTQFDALGCQTCHVRQLTVNDPIVKEPSSKAEFRDKTFPGGRSPTSLGLSTATQVKFNITHDLPDNADFVLPSGETLAQFEKNASGGAIVRLFGDLRRHDIGSDNAEQIDEVGTGKQTFLTENLWGVGTTPPYFHNGGASTLTEAILFHHGEAESNRTKFVALTTAQQQDLIAFLKNMVLFKVEQDE
jgi:hypothetical protein